MSAWYNTPTMSCKTCFAMWPRPHPRSNATGNCLKISKVYHQILQELTTTQKRSWKLSPHNSQMKAEEIHKQDTFWHHIFCLPVCTPSARQEVSNRLINSAVQSDEKRKAHTRSCNRLFWEGGASTLPLLVNNHTRHNSPIRLSCSSVFFWHFCQKRS